MTKSKYLGLFPAIFHFKNGDYEHYVVPYKIKKNIVYYCDPACGYAEDNLEAFNQKWTGIVFLVHPTSNFEKGADTKGFFSRFLVLLRPYRKYIFETFCMFFSPYIVKGKENSRSAVSGAEARL